MRWIGGILATAVLLFAGCEPGPEDTLSSSDALGVVEANDSGGMRYTVIRDKETGHRYLVVDKPSFRGGVSVTPMTEKEEKHGD